MRKLLVFAVCIAVAAGVMYVISNKGPETPPPPDTPSSSPSAPYVPNAAPGTPQEAVESILGSVKELDTSTIRELLGNAGGFNLGELSQKNRELLLPYTQRVHWDVGVVETEGDTATAAVSVTAPDLKGTIAALSADLIRHAAIEKLKGNNVDYEAYIQSYMQEKVDWDELPTATQELSVDLKRDENGVWKLDSREGNVEQLADALSGGLADTLRDFSSLVKQN